jgi:tetratricopeptide (TPR) repeat protein
MQNHKGQDMIKRIIQIIVIIFAYFLSGCGGSVSPENKKFSMLLTNEAVNYENVGNQAQAEQSYRGAVDKNPWNNDARMRLKNLYLRQGKYDSAIDVIKGMKGEDHAVNSHLGVLYLLKKDSDRALKMFESSAKEKPDFPTPYFYIGKILQSRGDIKNARENYSKYIGIYIKSPYRKSEENRVREAEDGIIKIDYPGEADKYFAALALFRGDRHAEAKRSLELMSSPPAITLLGRINKCYGKTAEAISILKKAGGYIPARTLLAEVLVSTSQKKNVDAALKLLAEVLKENPDSQEANIITARALYGTGREKEAAKYFKAAAGTGEDDAIALEAGKYIEAHESSAKSLSSAFKEYDTMVIKNSPHQEKLTGIMNKIVRVSSKKKESMPIVLSIYKGKRNEINALSIRDEGQGKVYLSDKLVSFVESLPVDRVQKDGIFACVIGHEVQHILDEHSEQVYSMDGILEGESLSASYDEKRIAKTSMNQMHEINADRFGSMLAYTAGYNPFMLKHFYSYLIESQGDIPKNMDHPTFRERIVKLDMIVAELKFAYANFKKGLTLLSSGKNEKPESAMARLRGAESSFSRFLGVFPENIAALNNMAVVYIQRALAGTAKPKYQFATQADISSGLADPERLESMAARRTRGRIRSAEREESRKPSLREIDKKSLSKGEEYLSRALKIDRGHASAMNNLGIVNAYLGRAKKAAEIFESILAKDKGNPYALNNLGVCRINSGKTEEGMSLIKKASRLAVARNNLR